MRHGKDAQRICADVRAEIERIQASLPEGVQLEVAYDRSAFIEASVQTLQRSLLGKACGGGFSDDLIFRSHPIRICGCGGPSNYLRFAFVSSHCRGSPSLLCHLAVLRWPLVRWWMRSLSWSTISQKQEEGKASRADMITAMQEVGPSVFVSLAILSVSFLPLLFLESMEGRLFRPLALTKPMPCSVGLWWPLF